MTNYDPHVAIAHCYDNILYKVKKGGERLGSNVIITYQSGRKAIAQIVFMLQKAADHASVGA